MNQFEQKVDIIPVNLQLVPKKKSQKFLKKKEQNLLNVIISSKFHHIPEFSALFGLNQQQCQSQKVDNIFRTAFIKTYTLNRNNQDTLTFLDSQLDTWFRNAKIIATLPREFHNSIRLGTTLQIGYQLIVESDNPEENFRALIEQKLKKLYDKASKNFDNEIKAQLNLIFQQFIKSPSEKVFEFISETTKLQIMIHTNLFPSPQPQIFLEGQKYQVSQTLNLERKFFHIFYSEAQNSYYDLCLKQEDCNKANHLPFITQEIRVFRDNCDEAIEFQIKKIKDRAKMIPILQKEIKASKSQILDQLFVKYCVQKIQTYDSSKEQQDYREKESECESKSQNQSESQRQSQGQSQSQSESENLNQKLKQKKKIVQQQEEPTQIQFIQQRFAQYKIDILMVDKDLQLIKSENSKIAYCDQNSFYELSQMAQKDIIKRLQTHYRVSLKQFINPCYFVGLLFLSFQQLDKKQQTSQFEISKESIQGLALQIDKFERRGVVYGSVLGFKIVNEIQLPKFFVFILKDMLGQNTIAHKNNRLRVFICPQCLCFDRFDFHICQNQ